MPIPIILKELLKKFKLFDSLNVNIKIGTKDIIIDHSNFNTLQLSADVEKVAKQLFEKGFGFTRADLASVQSQITSPAYRYGRIIETLKPYLRPPDHAALVCAAAIAQLEDRRLDIRRLRTNFRHSYGARGRRIYNMLRSEINKRLTILEGIIIPFLEEAKKAYPNDEVKVIGTFMLFFEEIMRYYPNAIWIHEHSVKKTAIDEVKLRMIKYPGTPVYIYARGALNTCLAEDICKELADIDISRTHYNLGWQRACRFTIIKKHS